MAKMKVVSVTTVCGVSDVAHTIAESLSRTVSEPATCGQSAYVSDYRAVDAYLHKLSL